MPEQETLKLWGWGVLIALIFGVSLYFGLRDAGQPADPVYAYCSYGSVSDAQRGGCERHVTEDEIDRLNTNAARFARGDLFSCLEDAGPFCETRDGIDKRWPEDKWPVEDNVDWGSSSGWDWDETSIEEEYEQFERDNPIP